MDESALIESIERDASREADKIDAQTRKIVEDRGKAAEQQIQKKEYSGILQDWIVEGAIGLNAEKAEVNASEAEMKLINRDLLTKAEAKVRDITGRKVNLVKSRRDPLSAQGVVLTTENGRISFNNQAPARFLRYQSEIRKLIMSELFE
jgi:vacuolar-type H+-ATPase subunit E/Vma4